MRGEALEPRYEDDWSKNIAGCLCNTGVFFFHSPTVMDQIFSFSEVRLTATHKRVLG
jgi:hypothetical protein